MRSRSSKLSAFVFIVLAFSIILTVPRLSSATTFTLAQTSISGITDVGTVTATQLGDDVLVTITLKPGYLFTAQGGLLMFDTRHGLTLSAGSLRGFNIRGLRQQLEPVTTMGGFTFTQVFGTSVRDGDEKDLDMSGLGFKRDFDDESFGPDGFRNIALRARHVDKDDNVLLSTLTFTVLDTKVSKLTGFGLQFCIADEGACTHTLGIANTTPSTPEPGTLALLGTGLVGIATLIRRSRNRQD